MKCKIFHAPNSIIIHWLRASLKEICLVGQNDDKGPIPGTKGDSTYKYRNKAYSVTMCYSWVIHGNLELLILHFIFECF